MKKETKQKLILGTAFVVLGFLAMQIPFTQLMGANIKFSLFDFFGPIVGGFLGSIPAMITVLIMQLANWAWQGFHTDVATLIRFLPMLAAVLYFSKKSKWTLLIPMAAIIAFWAHPEGRAAWYFALYWLIPIAMYFLHGKFIFARALGTTFTAHAVGGALWIWALHMKAAIWISLIPVVWKERGLMALGITLTYLLFKAVLEYSTRKSWLHLPALKLRPTQFH